MAAVPRLEELRAVALGSGVQHLGCTDAAPLAEAREALEERKAQGLNGSMQFTYKNPGRSTDPQATLPGARSILVGARSYHRHQPPAPDGVGPVARVARYVWADDHEVLVAGLGAVAAALKAAGWRACVVSDQNHLVDRAVAHRAGLGWFGKNANLLIPGAGSWFLLGSVLTDAPIDDAAPDPVPDGCGTCSRCLPACPTGAIVAPGVVDARRCLSWSLQTTGPFPVAHRVALGDRIYGCDECQEVCPPNRLEVRRSAPGGRSRRDLDQVGDPDRAWVAVLDLLEAGDDEILAAHGRWYVPERHPRYLRRNALVVLGNLDVVGAGGGGAIGAVGAGDAAGVEAERVEPRVRAVLSRCLAADDALVRAHAVWSARRLGCDDLLVDLADDPDPLVREELARPVPPRSSPGVVTAS
jgi:epoxyqueuosine reductase